MTNERPCDICNNNDIPCIVGCSSIVAMSFNYCSLCLSIGAEPQWADGKVSYDKATDRYVCEGEPIKIRTKRGLSFDTRAEIINFKGLKRV